MGKAGIRIENFFIALTLLTFATGMAIVNLAKDRVIGIGMILILLSAAFSISSAIFISRADGKKTAAKYLSLVITLIPALFTISYLVLAKD